MRNLVAAEILKLRTTRTALVFAGVALGLLGLSIALGLVFYEQAGAVLSVEERLRAALGNAAIAATIVLLLAIVATAGEFRHETASATFLVAPDRVRAVLAKAAAYALAGAALGLVCSALTAAVVLPVLAGKEGALALSGGEIALTFLGVTISSALAGVLGVGVGSLFRSQAIALVVALGVLVVLEPALIQVSREIGFYGINGAQASLIGQPPLERPPRVVGGLLLVLYSGIVLAGGAWVTRRRDVV